MSSRYPRTTSPPPLGAPAMTNEHRSARKWALASTIISTGYMIALLIASLVALSSISSYDGTSSGVTDATTLTTIQTGWSNPTTIGYTLVATYVLAIVGCLWLFILSGWRTAPKQMGSYKTWVIIVCVIDLACLTAWVVLWAVAFFLDGVKLGVGAACGALTTTSANSCTTFYESLRLWCGVLELVGFILLVWETYSIVAYYRLLTRLYKDPSYGTAHDPEGLPLTGKSAMTESSLRKSSSKSSWSTTQFSRSKKDDYSSYSFSKKSSSSRRARSYTPPPRSRSSSSKKRSTSKKRYSSDSSDCSTCEERAIGKLRGRSKTRTTSGRTSSVANNRRRGRSTSRNSRSSSKKR